MAQLPFLRLLTVLCNKAINRRLYDAITGNKQVIRTGNSILYFIRVCVFFA